MRPMRRRWWILGGWVLAVVCLAGPPAAAQDASIVLNVAPDGIGLNGTIRRGAWTALRLDLENAADQPRTVRCQWVLTDSDGDRVLMQREAVLPPRRPASLWLYGRTRYRPTGATGWLVQVLDAESGALLAERTVVPDPQRDLAPSRALIGLLGSRRMGLQAHLPHDTEHEEFELIDGLSLGSLPDRAHGLDALSTLVWSADDLARPNDPAAVGAPTRRAVRRWVRGGGHLVLVLPAVNEPWSQADDLVAMLPVPPDRMRVVQGQLPTWVGQPASAPLPEVAMTVMDVPADASVGVLRRNRAGEPVVVSGRYGFGAVTLIGIDLSDPAVRNVVPPSQQYPVWSAVFGWQAPVLSQARAEGLQSSGDFTPAERINAGELGADAANMLTLTGAASGVVLLAMATYGLYWLLAGPLLWLWLQGRKGTQRAWIGFIAVVAIFSLVAWAGATLLRPTDLRAGHFSVIDIDGRSGESRSRTISSIFVPSFQEARIAVGDVDQDDEASAGSGEPDGLLASPGLPLDLPGAFLDPQTYVMAAAEPDDAELPFRSTSKTFSLSHLASLAPEPYRTIRGTVRADADGWPTGTLTHDLPGTLENVRLVYCPGDGQVPWTWRYMVPGQSAGEWEPGQPLSLNGRITAQPAERLVRRPTDYFQPRRLNEEGFLGRLTSRIGPVGPGGVNVGGNASSGRLTEQLLLLSFFDMLPPPNTRPSMLSGSTRFSRAMLRDLDLTPLTHGRRLILIGHLPDSPMPLPVTVDGNTPEPQGWTMVRVIYDL
jgi:hypothetical protein